jgi:uncharacterized protein (DUF433 family)
MKASQREARQPSEGECGGIARLGAFHIRHFRKVEASQAMALTAVGTRYEHISLDETQTPVVAGTTLKVVELVLEQLAYGWSPEELHFQHPYLTLGQIHSALAYYWDHQPELDDDIERRMQTVKQLQQRVRPAPLLARLKAQGAI